MTSIFSPFSLPEDITLLITDALSAPANFLLHRTLAAYMKDRKDSDVKCVVLSVSEDISRWKALAAKSVINISSRLPSSLLKQKQVSRILTCSIAWTRDLSSSWMCSLMSNHPRMVLIYAQFMTVFKHAWGNLMIPCSLFSTTSQYWSG
jgi:hypothetical protein